MGVFGTGLYSGDFAMDLRSTIRAVSHLPFTPDRLVEILCESEPGAAKNPADEDHTTFWLVVADQFTKRGIESARVRDTALAIIDNGTDLATLEKLGMTALDIRKRKKMLDALHVRLVAPVKSKSRVVLQRPQKGSVSPEWQQDGWAAMVIVDRGRAFDFLSWYRPLTGRGGNCREAYARRLA